MPGLERYLARQLFSWHAFLQPSPLPEFETLVDNFLNACNGLPLSLKVLGAHLYGCWSKDYWKAQLDKITRLLPGDIQRRLMISYDALDEDEKEMFLDVACFFIGESKGTAIAVWDGMDLIGLHGLQTLVNKCLVELVPNFSNDEKNNFDEERIKMHDHLRDMGREIASRHSSYRLWWPGQIHNMNKHFKKEMSIRGIRHPATFQVFKEYKQQLLGISNGLRLLHVEGNEFTEEFASLSEDLVWLQWERFGLRNLPSWLKLRHLSVLELSFADWLEGLWEDNVDPPLQLRKLIISGSSRIKRLPTSIGRLQYLKMISFRFEGSSLPEEFCCLFSLEYLQLDCQQLRSLPAGFGNLVNLKHVDLKHCTELRTLPDSFKHLINLKHLDLFYCAKLKLKVDAFENTRKLKFLRLMGCEELEDLPNSKQLIHLEDLHISYLMLSTLPDGFGNLTSLTRINLESNSNLGRLPDSFDQLIILETLNLSSCKGLSSLPAGFGNLINLKHIDLTGCTELRTLPDSFKHLLHLEHLDLSYCAKLKLKLDAFENIRKLKSLGLEGCKELEDLPNEIVNQTSLTELNLGGCIKLRGLQTNIGQLVNLQSLTIESQILTNLQTSGVSFSSLKDINIWTSVQKIEVDGEEEDCKPVSRVSISNDCCPNLQNFTVHYVSEKNWHLVEIETLPASLKRLEINSCEVLKKMRCLTGLASLEELVICDCPLLEEISSFSDLVSLKDFEMIDCPKVEKIDGLQHNKALEELRLRGTGWKVAGIESLEKVEGLKLVDLECDTISAVKGCIQSMKKCPRKMRIKARFSRVVETIVNSQKFPDLALCEVKRRNSAYYVLSFVDDSVDHLYYEEGKERNEEGRKVVSIYVHLADAKNTWIDLFDERMEIERAVVVIGRRGRVVEAFNQILALLE